MEKLEDTILRNLLFDEDYTRKTLPFFRDEYFTTFSDRLIFEEIRKYFDKYSKQPSIEALGIELNGRNDIAEEQLKSAMESLETIEKDYKDETVTTDMNWLMEKSEKFCQDKALYNAIINSIAIFDENKTTKETKDAIPSILADALGVSFDVHIGHDYIDNADERFQFYRKKEEKIPFDLEYFNKITAGGLPRKTLNVALAGTGVGKSLFMCHMAASCLSENKNVLYVTLEMAEERIAERIDANLMNVTMDTLKEMPKTSYEKKIGKLKSEGKEVGELLNQVASIGERLDKSKIELEKIQNELNDYYMNIPNIPDISVPPGDSEDDNVEIRKWGEAQRAEFNQKDHVDLTSKSNSLSFDDAAKISGSRFAIMRGPLARMHRALVHFMLDIHTKEHGYEEVYVPYIVNKDSLKGTAKFKNYIQDLENALSSSKVR